MKLKKIFTENGSEYSERMFPYYQFRENILNDGYNGIELFTNVNPGNSHWI